MNKLFQWICFKCNDFYHLQMYENFLFLNLKNRNWDQKHHIILLFLDIELSYFQIYAFFTIF